MSRVMDGEKWQYEISPYELALLVWRLLDVESTLSREMLTNYEPFCARRPSPTSRIRIFYPKDEDASPLCCFPKKNKVKPSAEYGYYIEYDPIRRRAESVNSYEYLKVRSDNLNTILSDLEAAANRQLHIDSNTRRGLKELSNYRSHRAVGRMVLPGLSYLLYVFFATMMAILMTNGLFDEPTKFTHAVVNELGWGNPQKAINEISSFSELTTWWGVLAGFLWESSPMAMPFGEKIAQQATVYICMH
jgi:hypothetical protein